MQNTNVKKKHIGNESSLEWSKNLLSTGHFYYMNNYMREREREVVVEVSFESTLIASVTSMHSDFVQKLVSGCLLLIKVHEILFSPIDQMYKSHDQSTEK